MFTRCKDDVHELHQQFEKGKIDEYVAERHEKVPDSSLHDSNKVKPLLKFTRCACPSSSCSVQRNHLTDNTMYSVSKVMKW